MTHADCNLVMLPGVGADARLFGPQQEAFPHLVVPPWIPPQRHESLPDYAARLAQTIDDRRPLVLVGMSLGGMIGFEVARCLRPAALVLIATCRTRAGLRPLFRALRPLGAVLPAAALDLVKPLAPLGVQTFPGLTPTQRRMCIDMFQHADARFMHWALQALLDWRPEPLPEVPIYHIHGSRDRVIPARRVAADCYIADGGHLINLTHAAAVNAFIAAGMKKGLGIGD